MRSIERCRRGQNSWFENHTPRWRAIQAFAMYNAPDLVCTATKEGDVKRSLVVFGMAMAILLAWSVGRIQGQKAEGNVVFASADQADYTPMGKAEGVTRAVIWGNPDK